MVTTSLYIAGRGFLYKFDPRAKLFTLLALTLLLFLGSNHASLWLLNLAVFLLALYSTNFKQSLQPLKTIIFLVIIMILFVPLTYRDGTVIFKIGNFTVATKEALFNLNLLFARFLGITYMATLFIWTTKMVDIQLALRWYGLSYSGTLIVTLAFRFIPSVADSFQMIQDAHLLRSASDSTSSKRRIVDVVPTVTAALVVALKSIPYMAMSLEHRGFGRDNKRGSYRYLDPSVGLWFHFLIAVVVIGVAYFAFNIF